MGMDTVEQVSALQKLILSKLHEQEREKVKAGGLMEAGLG